MSRLRDSTNVPLIRGFFVFVVPPVGKIAPERAFVYPKSCVDELAELAGQVPLFCFPYPEKSSVALKRQEFTFVFTDGEGKYVFGYCLQKEPATPASNGECLCIVSQRPLCRLFKPTLKVLYDIWTRGATSTIESMLARMCEHFEGGKPAAPQFSFRDNDAKRVYTLECMETPKPLGYSDAVAGDPNIAILLQSLSPQNLVSIFASVLFERRVIIVSDSLDVVTGCCMGVERLCYPISWEGVYITIMPNHLLDYCSAPMPFLVGLHSSNWQQVSRMPLDDHVLVLADEDKIVAPFNDSDTLPSELASKLKSEFKHAKAVAKKEKRAPSADRRLSEAVAAVIDKLTGDFREHIRRVPDRKVPGKSTVEIDVDSFISSKPKAYHRARELLAASQSLRSFVDRRIDEITRVPAAETVRQSGRRASALGVSANPEATSLQRGATRRRSAKTMSYITSLLARRPDLAEQGEPAIFKAIWLGGTGIGEMQPTAKLGDHIVQAVLKKPSPPQPVKVLVFSETILLVVDKKVDVLLELATDEVVHCQDALHQGLAGSGGGLPMLTLMTVQGNTLARHGYVLATTKDALTKELASALVSVCPGLVSRNHGPVGAGGSASYASGRKAFSVRFLGERRVKDPLTITKKWLEQYLTKMPIPAEESILLITATSVKVVQPLTQRILHHNPTSIINLNSVQWAKWPSLKKKTASGDFAASSMRMTDEERMKVLKQVSAKKMTPDEAMAHVKAAEAKLFDTCVCYTWYDERLDCTELVLIGLAEGKDRAEDLVDTIESYRSLAKRGDADPFVARTRVSDKPVNAILDDYELDRSKVHVIRSLGAGRIGSVYLANRTVSKMEGQEPIHAWNLVRESVGPKEADVLCAIKVIPVRTRREHIRRFLMSCQLQLKLDHPNIVSLSGLCLRQKPFLRVAEFMRYGDLKRVLQSCLSKDISMYESEQVFVLLQLSAALEYLHQERIVHSNVLAKHILVHEGLNIKLSSFQNARRYDKGKEMHTIADSAIDLPYMHIAPECVPTAIFAAHGMDMSDVYNPTPELSQATDVWQFGVTMWEILKYGAQPYDNMGLMTALERKVKGNGALTCPAGTNPALVSLVEATMSFEPASRPTFSDVCTILTRLGGGDDTPRDIGHMISPDTKVKFETLAADLVRVRRETFAQLAEAGGSDHGTTRRANLKAQRRKSGTVFDLGQWRIDTRGQLVRTEDLAGVISPPPSSSGDVKAANPFLSEHSGSPGSGVSAEAAAAPDDSNPFLSRSRPRSGSSVGEQSRSTLLSPSSDSGPRSRERSATIATSLPQHPENKRENPFVESAKANADSSVKSMEQRTNNPFSPDKTPKTSECSPGNPFSTGDVESDDELDASTLAALQAAFGVAP